MLLNPNEVEDEHQLDKRNTQTIERKPLTLWMWIKRLARTMN